MTHESNIFHASIAAEAIRIVVMVLEPVALRTSPAVLRSVRALSPVTNPYGTLHRGRDAAFTRRRVCVFDVLFWTIRFAETLGFEPLEFFAHGRVDNRSQVTAGNECLESL